MSYRTKAHLGHILEVIGFFIALYGLQKIFNDGWYTGRSVLLLAMAILLIGVALFSYGAISSRYNAARDDNDGKSERLALETLAKLSKQQARHLSLKPKKSK